MSGNPVPQPTSSATFTRVSGTSSRRSRPNIADQSGSSSYAAIRCGDEKSGSNCRKSRASMRACYTRRQRLQPSRPVGRARRHIIRSLRSRQTMTRGHQAAHSPTTRSKPDVTKRDARRLTYRAGSRAPAGVSPGGPSRNQHSASSVLELMRPASSAIVTTIAPRSGGGSDGLDISAIDRRPACRFDPSRS